MAETQARIQLFSKDDAAVKAAQTNHVLDKDKRFVYQKWDAQASKLVTDPDKKGLTLEEGHPDGATQAQQRPDHHQVQHKSTPQEGTGQRRKGGIHCGSSNALATRQSHSGPPRSDDRQRGMGFGSRAVETTQSQAPRTSQCHPEGPGGRLDGPIQPGRSSPRSAPPLCPVTVPPVASQRMRNLSNTCYINSLTFTIPWQVQQRVDINVPEAWQRAQAQGTWNPANVLRFTILGWRQPINSTMSLSLCSSCFLASHG